MSHRIVVGGTTNCGKSTLAASIFRQLETSGERIGIYEIDTFSDTLPCILGVKPWSERKKRPAGNWKDPLIDVRLKEFADDPHQVVLGDLPGIIDGLLVRLVSEATGALVVSKDLDTLIQWENFFSQQNIPVLIRVVSYLDTMPYVPGRPDIIYVKGLCREVHHNGDVTRVVDRLREVCHLPALATM